MPQVQRLRPITILLVTRDPRFASVASFLFRRRGIEVEATHALSRVSHLVEICRPSIAVVDIDSLPPVHEPVSQLGIPVVLVAEDVDGTERLPALEKWGSFERLLEAVERCETEIAPPLGAGVSA